MIEEQLAELENHIQTIRDNKTPIKPDNAIGRLSRMEAMNEKQMRAASLRQSEDRVQRLRQALKRLDDSAFGECQMCGEAIAEKRLLLLPESTLCIQCLREQEQG